MGVQHWKRNHQGHGAAPSGVALFGVWSARLQIHAAASGEAYAMHDYQPEDERRISEAVSALRRGFIVRHLIVFGGLSALAWWAYSATDNVFFLLAVIWMVGVLVSGVTVTVLRGIRQSNVSGRVGFYSPLELALFTLAMAGASLIVHLTVEAHCWLIAHTVFWGIVGVGSLGKRA